MDNQQNAEAPPLGVFFEEPPELLSLLQLRLKQNKLKKPLKRALWDNRNSISHQDSIRMRGVRSNQPPLPCTTKPII